LRNIISSLHHAKMLILVGLLDIILEIVVKLNIAAYERILLYYIVILILLLIMLSLLKISPNLLPHIFGFQTSNVHRTRKISLYSSAKHLVSFFRTRLLCLLIFFFPLFNQPQGFSCERNS